jgi:hypothetical protein
MTRPESPLNGRKKQLLLKGLSRRQRERKTNSREISKTARKKLDDPKYSIKN